MRAINTLDLEALASQLDRDGVKGHEDELRDVAASARRAGVTPSLADLVSSANAAEIVRLRAFGKVAAMLAASPATTLVAHAA